MEGITLLSLLFLTSLLSCTGYKDRLTVSPDSSQFSEGNNVNLTCEEDKSFPDWTVRRNISKLQRVKCGDGWGKLHGHFCCIGTLMSNDTGVYWCESSNGTISNLVNITVTGKAGSGVLHSCYLLVFCPYFISTLLMVSLH
ncbi:unnamed protein product [Oreochromis niloticus]|nr:unnamed protein product [Mustela putorius furo]